MSSSSSTFPPKYVIPKMMKASVLDKFASPARFVEVPVPKVEGSDILVKIEIAPLNPADLSFMRGYYSSQKKLPVTLGYEGTGLVVDAGPDQYAQSLIGRKVAVLIDKGQHGSYAEYAVAESVQAIPFPDNISYMEGSSGLVNPMSAMLMWRKVQERKDKAVISNPAASALGRMLYRLLNHHGIPVINVVRRQELADQLRNEEGCEHVLVTEDPNFEEKLRILATKLEATVSFDAVGGPIAGNILKAMPDGSTVYIYGNLSMKNSEASQFDLIFKRKKVKGFWLTTQYKRFEPEELKKIYAEMAPLYKTVLGTKYSRIYPIEQVTEAVKYYLKHMSEGKILISATVSQVQELNQHQPIPKL